MQGLIDLMSDNVNLARLIWFGLGLIGFLILYKVRRSHFENHNIGWWIWLIIFYACVGPLIFISGLAALLNNKLRNKKQ